MNGTSWDRWSIHAEIRRRGMTLTRLAKIYGLEPRSVSVALVRVHRPAEAVISRYLDIPLGQLWPDRYDESNKSRSDVTAVSHRRASQNRLTIPDRRRA